MAYFSLGNAFDGWGVDKASGFSAALGLFYILGIQASWS